MAQPETVPESDTAFESFDNTKPLNNNQHTEKKNQTNTEKNPKAVMPKREGESAEDQYN